MKIRRHSGNLRIARAWIQAIPVISLLILAAAAANVWGDVPGPNGTNRTIKQGSAVPNPGTQVQELANITFPAPYNVFEFVVTCGACHGGTVDQNAAHFGNWAGTNMASAARDPIFRANEIIVNGAIQSATGKDGAGNMCFRCHSPNAWYSGRTDPGFNGSGDGSQMIQSILLSTDHEGISCEMCHRTVGNVTMKRGDLSQNDPAWKMMAGIDDWPHQGNPYPAGPLAGNPYGDATLQLNDGMTYGGKYSGSVGISFSDLPLFSTYYTGQTYGIYPAGWPNAGMPVVNPDGSVSVHFEYPIGPPLVNGSIDYQAQSVSLEHPTFKGDFIRTSEFCGSCHDLSVPVLNHGMPEQRTYTEWKYSSYGTYGTPDTQKRCQDCHMPTMKHEYADNAPISLNPDPVISGFFPYGKDRNPNGGTSFHKFGGANRDLPDMMTLLYPEVDLEVIGAPTLKDTRIFPGMMSDRSSMWERAKRNTDVMTNGAVTAEIVGISEPTPGNYQVQVKVTNNAGHRIPSGYPDGRRLWVSLKVASGSTTVYESGHYDNATATLYNDSSKTDFARALGSSISQANNAVMVYERKTGTTNGDGTYSMSVSLLNEAILFDNRIPPSGYGKDDYFAAGTKFITYTGSENQAIPADDYNRYPNNQNFDLITYSFSADPGLPLEARAEVYWQTHSREFMEFLKSNDTSTLAPQGPPSVFALNYPLEPNYLIDQVGVGNMFDLDGNPLNNNWGGIAYASWKLTGKGAPTLVAVADTAAAIPAVPTGLTVTSPDYLDPTVAITIKDPFSLDISWDRMTDADGYILWVRYGASDLTATWDKLAVVPQPPAGNPTYNHAALNVAKTYGYRVQAFNGAGVSDLTGSTPVVAQTPVDLPLNPINTVVVPPVYAHKVTLSWFDQADNEEGFIIQRQDVPPQGPYETIATAPARAGFGGVTWTDTTAMGGKSYNYQVAVYNASGTSTFDLPVTVTVPTTLAPDAGSAPVAIWRPSTGTWWFMASGGGDPTIIPLGTSDDKRVAADYDGDGRTDAAVWTPATGDWKIVRSSSGEQVTVNYGAAGDIPVPADYDGIGKAETAVWRNGIWFILNGNNNTQRTFAYGAAGDIPVPADYDGDGKADFAVWRSGTWYIMNSLTGTQTVISYGTTGDIPVPADYDGDGKCDVAVYRSGIWFIINSANSTQTVIQYGAADDIPVPGNYDQVGRAEIAVWRPSGAIWYIMNPVTSTQRVVAWGMSTDIPVKVGQRVQ